MKGGRTELSIESVSSPQMQLNRTCQREVHLAVLLVSSRFRRVDFTPWQGRTGQTLEEGYAITANFANGTKKRDLEGKEKGIYFPPLVYISLAVKANIAGVQLSRKGQRISSRFADYERDQVTTWPYYKPALVFEYNLEDIYSRVPSFPVGCHPS